MIESLSSIIAYFGKNTWLGDAGIVMFLGENSVCIVTQSHLVRIITRLRQHIRFTSQTHYNHLSLVNQCQTAATSGLSQF
jgi:hypothetical protein